MNYLFGIVCKIQRGGLQFPKEGVTTPLKKIRIADDESQAPDFSKWEEFRIRDFAQTCLAAKTQGRKKRKPERLYYYDDDLTATLASLKYQGDHKMKMPRPQISYEIPYMSEAWFCREMGD